MEERTNELSVTASRLIKLIEAAHERELREMETREIQEQIEYNARCLQVIEEQEHVAEIETRALEYVKEINAPQIEKLVPMESRAALIKETGKFIDTLEGRRETVLAKDEKDERNANFELVKSEHDRYIECQELAEIQIMLDRNIDLERNPEYRSIMDPERVDIMYAMYQVYKGEQLPFREPKEFSLDTRESRETSAPERETIELFAPKQEVQLERQEILEEKVPAFLRNREQEVVHSHEEVVQAKEDYERIQDSQIYAGTDPDAAKVLITQCEIYNEYEYAFKNLADQEPNRDARGDTGYDNPEEIKEELWAKVEDRKGITRDERDLDGDGNVSTKEDLIYRGADKNHDNEIDDYDEPSLDAPDWLQ